MKIKKAIIIIFILLLICSIILLSYKIRVLSSELEEKDKKFYLEKNSLIKTNKELSLENNALKSDAEKLKNEIQLINEELSLINNISICYIETDKRKVIVKNKTSLLALPIDTLKERRKIEPYTVVKVIDEVGCLGQAWYYVEVTVFDTPINVKGYIKVEDTDELNSENINEVKCPLDVLKGTTVYDIAYGNYDKVDITKKRTLDMDVSVKISDEKDEFFLVNGAGASEFWVNKEDVIYPSLE